jgi:hypothetical protein
VTTPSGDAVTLTAADLPAGATGTVTFVDGDGNTLCTIDLSVGQTSCTTSATRAAGTTTITPTWSGDADHHAATGDPFTFTVTPAAVVAPSGTPSASASASASPAAVTTASATAAAVATTADPNRSALAFTGTSFAVGMVGAGALLLLFAGFMLVMAGRLREAESAGIGPMRRGV